MEYNLPSEIVKDLNFGNDASDRIMKGVEQLAHAVRSTLGASGKCVIYEDGMGRPVITKDGVTVAESIILMDPVENMGAQMVKEVARDTVRQAGDGTTTATVLAHALLVNAKANLKDNNLRDIKAGLDSGLKKTLEYIDKIKRDVTDDKLLDIATISTNNDKELGKIISDAYLAVGKNGLVLMEESETEETYFDTVDGIQFDSGLKNIHFSTNDDRDKSILENPYVLLLANEITNIRKLLRVVEFSMKKKKPLLIIGHLAQQPLSALMANKAKGNMMVNVIDQPGFGSTKRDTMEDLAALTGAKIVDEALGDDLDLIDESVLGSALKCITDQKMSVITIQNVPDDATERIGLVEKKIEKEKNSFIKKKLEQRLAMLSGSVGVIHVGANSKVELKEKKDRVDDSIAATKAALKDGVVPGGGVALLNAAYFNTYGKDLSVGEAVFFNSITSPFKIILENAGLNHSDFKIEEQGLGVDVTTGYVVDMYHNGIIDPALVTKTALINAVSVAKTIISADCVISNKRLAQELN